MVNTNNNIPNDTPLMAQYKSIKSNHTDCLLLFRLGDFYELFFDDAVTASNVLDIVLTKRNKEKNGQDIPMCGIPFHAYESYVSKLLKNGFKVAICEQTETPAQAKLRSKTAIVNREVVRIITPGTITEDSFLSSDDNNFLMSIYCDFNNQNDKANNSEIYNYTVAYIDISANDFFIKNYNNTTDIYTLIGKINP